MIIIKLTYFCCLFIKAKIVFYDREYGTVPQDTKRAPFQWVSEVAYKNVHRIVTRGYDTTELIEEGYGVIEVLFVVAKEAFQKTG